MTTDPITDVSRLARAELARIEASAGTSGYGRQGAAAGGQPLPAAAASGPTASALSAAIEAVNQAVRSVARELSFRVDDDLGEVVVSVSDAETGELVRQIPAEHLLSMARMLQASDGARQNAERVRGLILDERA